ncbi:hypothetical protein PEB0122_013820 [Bartonella apis]|nr:hypothetical protein PEB0122_013820 [Bartonella apis]
MIFSMAGEIPAIEFYLWAGRVPVHRSFKIAGGDKNCLILGVQRK